MKKTPTSFRLSDECLRLLTALAEELGLNMTGVIELAVREMGRHYGMTRPAAETPRPDPQPPKGRGKK